MTVTMVKEYSGKLGRYRAGCVETVNRDTGKWLVRNGYAVETPSSTSNQDRFVAENRPPEQPQVIVMPYPVLPEEEEE